MPNDQSSYGANLLRQIGRGVSFNTADELEAMARARYGTPEYYALKAKLENQRAAWAEQNPVVSTVAELGGSVVPGVLGAFVPGPGWAATASTGARALSLVPRVARALDAPAEALMRVAAPRVLGALQQSGKLRAAGRAALGMTDELLNGAMYSVGEAPTFADVPQQIKDDLAQNFLMSLGVRAATSGGRRIAKPVVKGVKKLAPLSPLAVAADASDDTPLSEGAPLRVTITRPKGK
jgi:hypothetical protein